MGSLMPFIQYLWSFFSKKEGSSLEREKESLSMSKQERIWLPSSMTWDEASVSELPHMEQILLQQILNLPSSNVSSITLFKFLICIDCKIAIAPALLVGHHCSRHRDCLVGQYFVDTLVKTYNLHLLYFFENTLNTLFPGIHWEKGYKCGVNDCAAASISVQKMKHHMSVAHQVVHTSSLMSLVQIIFESNGQQYPVTISPSLLPSSSSNTF